MESDDRSLEKPTSTRDSLEVSSGPRAKKTRSRRHIRKFVSRRLGYLGLRLGHAVVSRLPLTCGLALSRVAGYLAYLFAHTPRRHAIESLTRVYGDELSDRQIRRRAREVFQHSVATAVEWMIIRRWSDERLLAAYGHIAESVRQVEREIKAGGTGIVGVTGHLGNWELLAFLYHRFAPGLLVPVAKRAYFEKYQDFLHGLRTDQGMEVIYNDSPRQMIHALRKGQMLGMLPDQDIRTNSGVFVDFFGKPAYTVTFPVELARKVNVKMFTAFIVREGGSLRKPTHRFQMVSSHLYDVPHTEDEEADILEGTKRWTSLFEDFIRQFPAQWCWIYPRWRSTPESPRLARERRAGR